MSIYETLYGISRTQAQSDDLAERMAAGDEVALAHYAAHQRDAIGNDLGDLETWPTELDGEAAPIDVPRMQPIYGWRYWSVEGSHLVSPFAGTRWKRGANTSSAGRCPRPASAHPATGCLCGLRVVQSRHILEIFAENMEAKTGPIGALARVAVWGAAVGPATGDDWIYTARVRHAQIVGPLFIASDVDGHGLSRRYGVPVEPI